MNWGKLICAYVDIYDSVKDHSGEPFDSFVMQFYYHENGKENPNSGYWDIFGMNDGQIPDWGTEDDWSRVWYLLDNKHIEVSWTDRYEPAAGDDRIYDPWEVQERIEKALSEIGRIESLFTEIYRQTGTDLTRIHLLRVPFMNVDVTIPEMTTVCEDPKAKPRSFDIVDDPEDPDTWTTVSEDMGARKIIGLLAGDDWYEQRGRPVKR